MSKLLLLDTEFTTYKDYLQNLLDPDNETDLSAVIGLRILTQVLYSHIIIKVFLNLFSNTNITHPTIYPHTKHKYLCM